MKYVKLDDAIKILELYKDMHLDFGFLDIIKSRFNKMAVDLK